MKRWLVLLYGIGAYLMFLGVFVYAILFVGNILISSSLDGQPTLGFWRALTIDLSLLALFAVQHSGMARPRFKRWFAQWVADPVERSTYVLLSNVAMILVFAFWQPLGATIWDVQSQVGIVAIYAVYFSGWAILLISTFAICHFDLFGLRQVWLYFKNKSYTHYDFRVPLLYSIVRHPLYVGWLIIFWAAPVMTLSHLLFATITTAYVLVAIQFEERDLINSFGRQYTEYRDRVPMLVPLKTKRRAVPTRPISVFHETFESRTR